MGEGCINEVGLMNSVGMGSLLMEKGEGFKQSSRVNTVLLTNTSAYLVHFTLFEDHTELAHPTSIRLNSHPPPADIPLLLTIPPPQQFNPPSLSLIPFPLSLAPSATFPLPITPPSRRQIITNLSWNAIPYQNLMLSNRIHPQHPPTPSVPSPSRTPHPRTPLSSTPLESTEPPLREEGDSCLYEIDLSAERWIRKQEQDPERIRALIYPEDNSLSKVERKLIKKRVKELEAASLQRRGMDCRGEITPLPLPCPQPSEHTANKSEASKKNPQLLAQPSSHPQYPTSPPCPLPNLFALQSLVPPPAKTLRPRPLPAHFPLELQVYQWLADNPTYFELPSNFSQSQLPDYLLHPSPRFSRLFWKMHQFILRETSETPNELTSLWQFAFQGNFAEQLFGGNWKYLTSLSQLATLQSALTPTYRQLLQYICGLIGASCDTREYRALLGERVNCQRDASRLQQQVRESRRGVERVLNSLQGELQAERKKLQDAQRSLAYLMTERVPDQLGFYSAQQAKKSDCQRKITLLEEKKQQLLQERASPDLNPDISELPEQGCVSFLGLDSQQNLYWAVRDRPTRLYREDARTGEWSAFDGEEIVQVVRELDSAGREGRLRGKIGEGLQAGWLAVEGKTLQDESGATGERVAGSIEEYLKPPTSTSIFNLIQQTDQLITYHLKSRGTSWQSPSNRIAFLARFQHPSPLPVLLQLLLNFNRKICIVEVQLRERSRKIQTKLWGFHERAKQEWVQLVSKASSLEQLHFLADTLLQIVRKYVSKQRPHPHKYTPVKKPSPASDSPFKPLSSSEPQDPEPQTPPGFTLRSKSRPRYPHTIELSPDQL